MLLEDYVHLLSKPAFYITQRGKCLPMRTLKWDPIFNPGAETTMVVAWILFTGLPPNFFGEEALFSLASAVGILLQVDTTSKNQTRPSCARVKVEVDLVEDFPKRIKVGIKKGDEEVLEKWIRIKYDYVPKYCVTRFKVTRRINVMLSIQSCTKNKRKRMSRRRKNQRY